MFGMQKLLLFSELYPTRKFRRVTKFKKQIGRKSDQEASTLQLRLLTHSRFAYKYTFIGTVTTFWSSSGPLSGLNVTINFLPYSAKKIIGYKCYYYHFRIFEFHMPRETCWLLPEHFPGLPQSKM